MSTYSEAMRRYEAEQRRNEHVFAAAERGPMVLH